jgi:hypothetical protein
LTVTVLDDFDVADGVYEGTPDWEGMIRQPVGPLVASAIPVKPPAAWFTNPNFSQLTPLSITSDGRVAGHIASWREDHIGMNGRVRAPRSKSGYAFFATGALETAEGTMVNVGQITLVGGHATLEASVAEAVAHYDNTDSAMMDVAVGEDRHGIWAAGALRPTVNDIQLRALRASSVSGDWRPINGSLEMVAVCAVNVPGFPIPRARVASGMTLALVAAGTGALVDLALHQDSGNADEIAASFDDRLRLVENIVLGKIGDHREALTAAVEEARRTLDGDGEDLQARVASLRERVHPVDPVVAALRERAHSSEIWDGDGMEIEYTIDECRQIALRASVHGPIVGRATSAWTAKEREKAANRGVAMPGGRYPIKDKADVRKAIRAVGRGKGSHAAIRKHIIKRAKALGAMEMVPDNWK